MKGRRWAILPRDLHAAAGGEEDLCLLPVASSNGRLFICSRRSPITDAQEFDANDVHVLLCCSAEELKGTRVDNSDPFYNVLAVIFNWEHAVEHARSKEASAPIRVPKLVQSLLQNAYLIPLRGEDAPAPTLDQAFLTCRFAKSHGIASILSLLFLYWHATTMMTHTLAQVVSAVMSTHAPLGIKLNPQVDFLLGNFILLFLEVWDEHVLPVLLPSFLLVWLLYTILVRRTWPNNALAFVFDYLTVASLHIAILHRLLSRVFRFQLFLLHTCLLLMRGRKVNVLKRNRIDAVHTDSALLLVGTVAAFFLVFTLQTTLTYHVILLSFALVGFAMQSALLFLLLLASVSNGGEGEEVSRAGRIQLVLEHDLWTMRVVEDAMGEHGWRMRCAKVASYAQVLFHRNVWLKVLQGHELPFALSLLPP